MYACMYVYLLIHSPRDSCITACACQTPSRALPGPNARSRAAGTENGREQLTEKIHRRSVVTRSHATRVSIWMTYDCLKKT